MKIIKKIVLWLVVIVGLLALVIAILRWVNSAETARLEEVKQSTRDQYSYTKGLNRDDIAKSSIPGVDISEIKEQHAAANQTQRSHRAVRRQRGVGESKPGSPVVYERLRGFCDVFLW